MSAPGDRLKHWGWGRESRALDRSALEALVPIVAEHLGFSAQSPEDPVALESIELPAARISPPSALAAIVSADRYERVSRSLGKAYRDVVRGMRGRFDHIPDLIASPRSEDEVASVLDWCAQEGLAAIPFGGGTSVVAGIEPRMTGEYPGVVTIDMRRMDRVTGLDERAGSAEIQAGATGPVLERQLGERGMTMRCYPQSFEFSTLGGWVATRAGGHFATGETHVDDLVESITAITPAGLWESRRLPGSGAGPSPDRMLLGSEGILGVITAARVRVRQRPAFKASCPVSFDEFDNGVEAARELAQSGLEPANCRLLDPTESMINRVGQPGKAILLIGFESAGLPVRADLDLALGIAQAHGGVAGEIRASEPGGGSDGDGGEGAVGTWRDAFLEMPYLRDSMVRIGVLSETFETAITWDRFEELRAAVLGAAREALGNEAGEPVVGCRFTHVYPGGPAPYFTVLAPARRGSEVEQWDEVKAAVSEALISAGGTITHHHAVGRDHRPWYDRQRPEPFAAALRAAKRELDPGAILNPGVLIDP